VGEQEKPGFGGVGEENAAADRGMDRGIQAKGREIKPRRLLAPYLFQCRGVGRRMVTLANGAAMG
jgi:hypothetical protein